MQLCTKVIVFVISVSGAFAVVPKHEESKPVTRVATKDASIDGIRLPNATLCVKFNTIVFSNENNFTDVNFANLSSKNIYQAIRNSLEKKAFDHPLTVLFNKDNYDWDKEIEYDNILAKYLCDLLQVQLFITDTETSRLDVDICKLSESGRLPFTINPGHNICLRIPLELYTLKQGPVLFTPNDTVFTTREGAVGINENDRQFIRLAYRPMAVRKVFPKPENEENEIRSFLFFSETPASYISVDEPKRIMTYSKVQFMHELRFPNDINYMSQTDVNVMFDINAKYTTVDDSRECTDVHDGTTCEVKCIEEEFLSICNCYRYENRQFLENPDQKPFCNVDDIEKCYKNQPQFARSIFWGARNLSANPSLAKCMDECEKCSKLIFYSEISEKINDWKKSSAYQTKMCNYYPHFNGSCQEFVESIESYIPLMRENFHNWKGETSSTLFGIVMYQFSMKSFMYPEFTETKNAGFKTKVDQ